MNHYSQSQSLTIIEKWSIYCLYLVRYFSLKYCRIISLGKVNGESVLSIYNYDLTRSQCISFNEFISPDNVIKIDMGEEWNQQGYAQRSWIDYPIDSLAYWFIRHKEFYK